MIDVDSLSDTQRRALRELARVPNYGTPMGGHKRGPILSACRALVRKGVLRQCQATSSYAIADKYTDMAAAELARWRELQKQTREATP